MILRNLGTTNMQVEFTPNIVWKHLRNYLQFQLEIFDNIVQRFPTTKFKMVIFFLKNIIKNVWHNQCVIK